MIRIYYGEDCKRLQEAFLREGWHATLPECQDFWERHSDDHCASWLMLPEDDADLATIIVEHLQSWA